MKWSTAVRLAALAAGLSLAASPATAAEPGPLSKEAVEQIVRDYLRQHPEVVVEALTEMERRRREAAQQRSREAIAARRQELVADADAPVAGSPAADVTVVEFFDYQCGYCKRAAPAVKELLRTDPRVRLVYKEFPILGEESRTAARAALAARAQGKYVELHDALMAATAPLTGAEVLRLAGAAGLDVARLEADMKAPAIRAAIDRNLALAQALGINGTPAFVIGGELVPGAAPLDELQRLVEQARRAAAGAK